jgi:hypothetical protein
MPIGPNVKCPGSAMRMVTRVYTIRKIEPEERAKNARSIHNAKNRGDFEEAESYKEILRAVGEATRSGTGRGRLRVCDDRWLKTDLSRSSSGPTRGHQPLAAPAVLPIR